MQGENISSILCTNSIDKISKDCKISPFEYRGKKIVPKMGFVDDVLDIAKCGEETKAMNKYTTDEMNKRKLQLSYDKCSKIHISPKNIPEDKIKECEDITIDLWTVWHC